MSYDGTMTNYSSALFLHLRFRFGLVVNWTNVTLVRQTIIKKHFRGELSVRRAWHPRELIRSRAGG